MSIEIDLMMAAEASVKRPSLQNPFKIYIFRSKELARSITEEMELRLKSLEVQRALIIKGVILVT